MVAVTVEGSFENLDADGGVVDFELDDFVGVDFFELEEVDLPFAG